MIAVNAHLLGFVMDFRCSFCRFITETFALKFIKFLTMIENCVY